MKKFLKIMRIPHYIKNALILAPAIFSGKLLQAQVLRVSLRGFVLFCLISSIVYIFNDIRDIQMDRMHPVKRNRPIASGAVSIWQGSALSLGLLALTVALHFLFELPYTSLLYLLGYLIINAAYSLGLKNYPIVDITILVLGFLLRVLFGSAITGIEVSRWMYLTVIAFSFFFAFGKRRNELLRQKPEGGTRQVLQHYTHSFLDKSMYLFLALSNVFYSLWSMESTRNLLVWTVPLVFLICLKYSLTIESDSDGDPVEVLIHDTGLAILCAVYAVSLLFILYLRA